MTEAACATAVLTFLHRLKFSPVVRSIPPRVGLAGTKDRVACAAARTGTLTSTLRTGLGTAMTPSIPPEEGLSRNYRRHEQPVCVMSRGELRASRVWAWERLRTRGSSGWACGSRVRTNVPSTLPWA